ncbi:DNA helicase [Bertholletia excelsa]
MVEPDNSMEMAPPLRLWLSNCAPEISHLVGWKVPSGSDDGGDGKESKNSIRISTTLIPLIKIFKRLTAHFVVKMEQGELRKQWTWEPRMSESLILLLVDPNDNARQVGRRILEQVSDTRGLACGLQFLCSSSSSLSAVLIGLRHALKLVQMDSRLLKFKTLHHFFFVLCKLLKEGVSSTPTLAGTLSHDQSTSRFSLQGGFLHQQPLNFLPNKVEAQPEFVSSSWEDFSCLAAGVAWPFIQKCLVDGKAFIDDRISLMTCLRLLEILPVVFRKLLPPLHKVLATSGIMLDNVIDYKWLNDLIDWGRSSVAVIVRYWRDTLISLLGLFKQSCQNNFVSAINAVEKLLSCDTFAMDELIEQVAGLSVLLSDGGTFAVKDRKLKSDSLVKDAKLSSESADMQLQNSMLSSNKRTADTVIVLSDDEMEMGVSADKTNPSDARASQRVLDDKTSPVGRFFLGVFSNEGFSSNGTSEKVIKDSNQADASDCTGFVSQKLDSDASKVRQGLDRGDFISSKDIDSNSKNRNFKCKVTSSFPSQTKSNSKNFSSAIVCSKTINQACVDKNSMKSNTVIKQLIHDAEEDPLELALKTSRHQPSSAVKSSASGPKRQVIQLDLPVKNKSGYLLRLGEVVKRFKPPRLDDWYRPILEINYFATVGLASASENEKRVASKLREVPVSFESPDQYVDIFRPLILEEFKAQLHSSFLEMTSLEEMSCGCLSVLSVERIDDFHLVRCAHDDGDPAGCRSCSENDLILLTRQPLQHSSHDVHMVGKVEKREKDNKRRSSLLVIRFYLQGGSSRLNRARKLLLERSKWYVSRIMTITPQLREFQALSSINDIPTLPIILNPINHPSGRHESGKSDLTKLPQPLQHVLKSSYNDSQLKAINAAIGPLDSNKAYEMSLIQGPPGTGKTRTILAIVSCLLGFSLQQKNDMKKPRDGCVKPSNCTFSNLRPRVSESAAIARAWQDAALARQLNEGVEKNCKSVGSCKRGRVLICAQSNAAVDELVSRIYSEGLYGSDGTKYRPYLVRVGNAKTVHPNSLPFFIDTLVDQKLAEERMNARDAQNDSDVDSSMAVRAKLEKLVDHIRFYEAQRANLNELNNNSKNLLESEPSKGNGTKEMSDVEIDAKLRKLYQEKKEMYINLARAQAREKKENEESKTIRHRLRRSILSEAEIVVATLSGSGGDLYGVCSESLSSHKFSNSSEHALFDAVIIDEAAQALEPATLIPLQLLKSKGTKCIMVGDPKQLPATVLSNVASKYLYQCSMFERLQRAGHPVLMLTKQYRMHPEICRFPSLHFYDNKLINGDNMSGKSAPFHETEGLGPYVFFDIVDGHELHEKSSGGLSLYNESEADAAVEILEFFKKRHPSEFVSGRIGIITPYKRQLSLLRSRFSSAFGSSIAAEMEFNTVDGFQGREVDILVLSTVRAAETRTTTSKINSRSIGFVADVRRMNVALTRAKLSLWILGNARTLQTNQNWAAL